MKKSLIIAVSAAMLVILVNVYLFVNFYTEQINYQKNILFNQADLCSNNIENELQRFESDLNYILFSDDINDLFKDGAENSVPLRKLELFYSSYSALIKNIDIYDVNKNVLNLFRDKKKNFITDKYLAQRQRKLVDKEEVKSRDSEYQYYIPVFRDNTVFGNIVVTVDISQYIIAEVDKFHLGSICFQSVIDPETKNFITNYPGNDIKIEKMDDIIQNLNNDFEGLERHKIVSDSTVARIITVYTPIKVLDHKFGLAFSFNNTYFIKKIFARLTVISAISLIIFIAVLIYLLWELWSNHKKKDLTLREAERIGNIIENLPVGVIIFDRDHKIRFINSVAREMLQYKEEEQSGNAIINKFLGSGRQLLTKNKASAYDTNQFVLYQKEGNEVVLYRKEFPFVEGDEELMLSAFIEITSIEKSRKYEAAANTAKSEFLAKMSHEIRTPMNGIIGMTDALNKENLTKEQREYVEIVKKSADLLLNIINDILDYSKIEAGKMQIEEIPFRLSEEVKLSLDLFRSIIEDKGLKLNIKIAEDVPEDIIGDPFRLRQVLTNLISNAVKFTHEGEIRITVSVDEQYNGNLSLLFEVADTGVGIAKERLDSVFNSFTQADQSTSRKYGGSGLGTTIAKQLVNLMNGEIWVESPSDISKNKAYPGSKFCFTIETYANVDLEKDIDLKHIKNLTDIKGFILTKNMSTKKRLLTFLKHQQIEYDHVVFKANNEVIPSIKKQLLGEQKYHLIFILDEIDFDGLWVARQLVSSGVMDKFKVIMISSNHKQENYIQSKVSRVDYYLTQPFDQNILKNYIYRCFPSIERQDEATDINLQKDLTILVAEDNIINQKVAESIFGNLGYKIDLALDGKEVVEMVKKKAYDIIFMDLQMPEKDGMDATVEIRALGFQMPIVAMTATVSKSGKNNALLSGMNDYITKPVRVEAVREVLQKWFA